MGVWFGSPTGRGVGISLIPGMMVGVEILDGAAVFDCLILRVLIDWRGMA